LLRHLVDVSDVTKAAPFWNLGLLKVLIGGHDWLPVIASGEPGKCRNVASTPASVNRSELVHGIMTEYRGGLISYAEKMLGDRHLAEDVVQETMIRAWRHIERLRSTEGSIRSWLFVVTRNLVIDWTRKSYVRYEMERSYSSPGTTAPRTAVLRLRLHARMHDRILRRRVGCRGRAVFLNTA
jgi:RNA polymerase sigma-70 factor (ECF subfamily)